MIDVIDTMNAGEYFGALGKSSKVLEAAIPGLIKKAKAFEDKHGIIGNNVSAKKLAAYKWELSIRKL